MIGILRGQLLVDVDPEAGSISRVHVPFAETVPMGEHLVGQTGMRHVFLDAEVVDGEPEVQRRRHGDGRKVGRTVEAVRT